MFSLIKAVKHNILLIFVFEVKHLSQIIYGQMCALFDWLVIPSYSVSCLLCCFFALNLLFYYDIDPVS